MKILITNQFGNSEVKETNILPRIGDKIDVFYEPMPAVDNVLLWPSEKRLRLLGMGGTGIEVVVTVS